jgi:hypothetical protein
MLFGEFLYAKEIQKSEELTLNLDNLWTVGISGLFEPYKAYKGI